MNAARQPEHDESVLRQLARDPDYATNAMLRVFLERMDYAFCTRSVTAAIHARIKTCCGMLGEMIGHLWSAILMARPDEVDFDWWIRSVEHHCALVMNEQSGLPFFTDASIFFMGKLAKSEIPPLDAGICGRIRDFSERSIEPVFGSELECAFRTWTERATARFLHLYHHTSDYDAPDLLDSLASCYAANVHIMAIVIEMWFHLEVTRNER